MSSPQPEDTDPMWHDLRRELPAWFLESPLGIFVHWGVYSVPAWAEPSGALGTIPDTEWFSHNPYAEWYYNTIRVDGSPAQQYHQQTFGGAPYDDFIDAWKAESWDPAAWAQLFARAGAGYVVETTKHHDGITLWDAPGTGTRNTVRRGPKRDLVGDLSVAVREAGLRFGAYYSGGLDWSVTDLPPIRTEADVRGLRPNDAAYSMYAYSHMRDLIDRYQPDLLWNDIEWPDFAKGHLGSYGLHALFDYYYSAVPEGVVNDRYGNTHWDYKTSEYEHSKHNEQQASAWQQCRGLGFSFGYNRNEDESVTLSALALIRLLSDIVSRGGHLLLNVGPTAAGLIPPIQQQSLEGLGEWMRSGGTHVLYGSTIVPADLAQPSDEPWVRWMQKGTSLFAIVDADGAVRLPVTGAAVDASAVRAVDGSSLTSRSDAGTVVVDVPRREAPGPALLELPLS
jgi:alpha-L-fucosidase